MTGRARQEPNQALQNPLDPPCQASTVIPFLDTKPITNRDSGQLVLKPFDILQHYRDSSG